MVDVKVNGQYGMIVEINSETDFVARDENFQAFVKTVLDAAFDGKQTDLQGLFFEH